MGRILIFSNWVSKFVANKPISNQRPQWTDSEPCITTVLSTWSCVPTPRHFRGDLWKTNTDTFTAVNCIVVNLCSESLSIYWVYECILHSKYNLGMRQGGGLCMRIYLGNPSEWAHVYICIWSACSESLSSSCHNGSYQYHFSKHFCENKWELWSDYHLLFPDILNIPKARKGSAFVRISDNCEVTTNRPCLLFLLNIIKAWKAREDPWLLNIQSGKWQWLEYRCFVCIHDIIRESVDSLCRGGMDMQYYAIQTWAAKTLLKISYKTIIGT